MFKRISYSAGRTSKVHNLNHPVEWITIRLRHPSFMTEVIHHDYDIWTCDHAPFPFYRGKQVWTSPTDPCLFTCILYWETFSAWKSLPEASVQRCYEIFDERTQGLTCGFKQITASCRINKVLERNKGKIVGSKLKMTATTLSVQELEEIVKNRMAERSFEVWSQEESKTNYFLLYDASKEEERQLESLIPQTVGVRDNLPEKYQVMRID